MVFGQNLEILTSAKNHTRQLDISRETEWRKFQLCSTFHFAVKSGQRMSSISVKTPYYSPRFSAKNLRSLPLPLSPPPPLPPSPLSPSPPHRWLFRLPVSEPLDGLCECTMWNPASKSLIFGKLFCSPDYLCFNSKVSGSRDCHVMVM